MSRTARRCTSSARLVAYEHAQHPGAEAQRAQAQSRARGRDQLDYAGRAAATELWRVPGRVTERRVARASGKPDPAQAQSGRLSVCRDPRTVRFRLAARTQAFGDAALL